MPPGPPSGGWPSNGYPGGPNPPGGNRKGLVFGIIALVVLVIGGVVAGVLLTQGDDKDKAADGSSGSPTATSSATGATSAPATTKPPTTSATSRTPTATATTAGPGGRGSVLGNLKDGDCIGDVATTAIVVDPIQSVTCGTSTARWKVLGLFSPPDAETCEALPAQKGYVGHIKEFSSNGRIACLGFTKSTTLQNLKNLAGAQVANLSEDEFDQLVQSYKDRGVEIS